MSFYAGFLIYSDCDDCVTERDKRMGKVYDDLEEYLKTLQESQKKLPADYESCGECGYDHEYEQVEAYAYHSAIPAKLVPFHN